MSGIEWEWQAPSGREILAVEPVAMGAAVMLDTGIVVLHGDTGQEVWSRLAPEGESFSASLTEDDSAFLVAHGPSRDEPPEETLILDADTGTATGEFRVQKDLAPWDLWRVSETERVHRPQGVVEEYRPLSVIEVTSGDQRWEQSEPIACETDPGLTSSQDDARIHDSALLVLVTCSPERFEDPLEVATAVVALDIADGDELWRQEFTYTSEVTFPHASLAAVGDSVFLSGDELQEVHAIGAEDGEVLASVEATALAFQDDGALLQVAEGSGIRYELRDAGMETISSVEVPERSGESAEDPHAVSLRDGVVGVEFLEDDADSTGITLGFTSWEEGESELVEPALPVRQGTDLDEFTGSLVRVPGAVVLSGEELPETEGLVAYQ